MHNESIPERTAAAVAAWRDAEVAKWRAIAAAAQPAPRPESV